MNLLVGGCYQTCNNAPQSEYLSSNGTLSNNIQLGTQYYFENTAEVSIDSKINQTGSIVVSTGDPFNLLYKKLFDSNGRVDPSPSVVKNFPSIDSAIIGTDNQLVRMMDGALLCIRASSIWTHLQNTPYSGENIEGERNSKHKGLRDCIHFFRSIDGGITWSKYSEIDFGKILNGKYGFPQDKGGYWQGGGDREEIYICPFTNNMYLSTRIKCGLKNHSTHQNTNVVFWSKDMGKNWELLQDGIAAWSPLVMTSTQDGRLFLFHVIGQTPTIYYSTSPVHAGVKPQISHGYPVFYVENGKNVPSQVDTNNMVNIVFDTPSISRIGVDNNCSKVRVVYHSTNSAGRQTAKIIRIVVKNPNQSPLVSPIASIEAENKNSSVIHFTFVDPDYVDLPRGTDSNRSVLYWIESPIKNTQPATFSAKYVTLEGDFNISTPAYLSLNNGYPRSWYDIADPSHYMTGGFFWRNDMLNYLCQWVEPSGIYANIVSMPYHPPSSPQDPSECNTIQNDINKKEKIIAGLSKGGNTKFQNDLMNSLRHQIGLLKEMKKRLGCYLN